MPFDLFVKSKAKPFGLPELRAVMKGAPAVEHSPGVYRAAHQGGGEWCLVDLTHDGKIYAETVVPEYWIVDLVGRAVEVYTEPRDGRYATVIRIDDDGVLRPAAFPEVAIPVAEILPPR